MMYWPLMHKDAHTGRLQYVPSQSDQTAGCPFAPCQWCGISSWRMAPKMVCVLSSTCVVKMHTLYLPNASLAFPFSLHETKAITTFSTTCLFKSASRTPSFPPPPISCGAIDTQLNYTMASTPTAAGGAMIMGCLPARPARGLASSPSCTQYARTQPQALARPCSWGMSTAQAVNTLNNMRIKKRRTYVTVCTLNDVVLASLFNL